MIHYRPQAARALGFLKRPYNDVDIYVEDARIIGAYYLMIRRLLPSSVRLASINALGGREDVLSACRADQENDGRRKLYIIDGDFDALLGRSKPRLRHLYRLRAYSVENLLISAPHIEQIAVEAAPNQPGDAVIGALDFSRWFDRTIRTLTPLVIVYAASHELTPQFPTIGFSVFRLCNAGPIGLEACPVRTRSRIRQLARDCCRAVGNGKYRQLRRAVTSNVLRGSIEIARLIAGKDYLFPLLWRRLHDGAGYAERIDQLKSRLAAKFEASAEPYLARRLSAL